MRTKVQPGQRHERIRGPALQRLRDAVFAAHAGLCVECSARGRLRPAAELDHKLPLFAGGDNSVDNLQPLCRRCHEVKTLRERGCAVRPAIGLDGWPLAE